MEIINNLQINNKPNFKGTFVLNPQNVQVRKVIPDIIKKGRQIFYDIKNEGDVVIVTKDKYDKRVRDFIEEKNLEFSYYPEISTRSGLDDEIPSGLKTLINIKNNCVIKDLNLLDKFLFNTKLHLSKQSEYLQEAMDTLRLNTENAKISIDDKGLFVIRDNSKLRTIKSTGFNSGFAYVSVVPDSTGQEIKRYLIGKNGKEIIKEFNTPKEILGFNKIFKKIRDSI